MMHKIQIKQFIYNKKQVIFKEPMIFYWYINKDGVCCFVDEIIGCDSYGLEMEEAFSILLEEVLMLWEEIGLNADNNSMTKECKELQQTILDVVESVEDVDEPNLTWKKFVEERQ